MEFSRQHIAGYEGELCYGLQSDGRGNVYLSLKYGQQAAPRVEFIVSGEAENIRPLCHFFRVLANELDQECERVIGREREQMNREMEQAERDQIEAHNDARSQGY